MSAPVPDAFAILETAAALAFVYFMLSLICSSVNEAFCSLINLRAKTLKKGVSTILHDTGLAGTFAKDFFAHGLIKGLSKKGLPSQIPPETFAMVVLGMVKEKNGGTAVAKSADISGLNNDVLEQGLKVLVDSADGTAVDIRKKLADWYDSAMPEVSAWYKTRVQYIMLVIGFCLAVALNVDTIAITKALIEQPTLREEILVKADTMSKQVALMDKPEAVEDKVWIDQKVDKNLTDLSKDFNALQLPIGWGSNTDAPKDFNILFALIGWFLTGIAISFGAPFWFKVLNKLIDIRNGTKQSMPASR